MKKLSLLAILVACVLSSCIKEEGAVPTEIMFPELTGETTASIKGRVSDIEDKNLVNAKITCLSCVTEINVDTDANGNFSFEDVTVNGDQAFLKISFPGKFDCYRKLPLLADKVNYTSIKLREKSLIGTVESSNGGSLEHSSGAKIVLPSDGIVDAEGNTHNGEVKVYMSWIDPSSPVLQEMMMGDLSGIDEDNETQALRTFGMLQVELEDGVGRALNLKSETIAELSFPVPNSMQSKAPSSIPIWSYDETHGYWVEEGEASFDNGFYIADVSHFSTWNVDSKTPNPIEICGSIVNREILNESGLPFYRVELCGESFEGVGGFLCEDGSFRFINVPENENVILKVYNYCDELIQTLELGSFGENVKLEPIILNEDVSTINVTGNALNCNQLPVSKGIVKINVNNRVFEFDLENDGSFDFGLIKCLDTDLEMEIYDLESFQVSSVILISGLEEEYVFNDVIVCNDFFPYFYFYMEADGEVTEVFRVNTTSIYYETFVGFTGLVFSSNEPWIRWSFELNSAPMINEVITGQIYDVSANGIGELIGSSIQFLITDLGPEDANGNFEFIEGSYSGFVMDELWPVNGTFKIGPKE